MPWAQDGDRLIIEDDYHAGLCQDRVPVGALPGLAAGAGLPHRKNVIAKCYGGDVSRKRKRLEAYKGVWTTAEISAVRDVLGS